MPRRNRQTQTPRRARESETTKRILIVCEGEVTEQQYFDAFTASRRDNTVEVRVVGPAGDPVTLVQTAKLLRDEAQSKADRLRDASERFDEVWCCFDVDLFGSRVATARDQANANGLRLAMSNPCFELWLLLHLRDSPGPRGHHGMQDVWKHEQPELDDKHIDFEALKGGYEDAVRRAEKLEADATAAGEPNREPTTEVFHLTNSIDEDGQAQRTQARRNRRDASRRDESSLAKAQAAAAAALVQASAEAGDDEGEQE